MKKVLVIAYFFPPTGGGGVQRVSKFVKYLPSFGWSPVVLTVRDPDFDIFDESLLEDLPAEVDSCGENGEFHTFVYDGPVFKKPIPV